MSSFALLEIMRFLTNKNIRVMVFMAILALGCFSYYTLSSQAQKNANEQQRDSKIDKILAIANDSDMTDQQINVFVIAKNTTALINDSVGKVSPSAAPFLVNLTQ